ncbi:hypothetical protein [Hymenobacter coccineus]|uniref:Uncharacterized protein n=1 Tax=Hymenobacter coccineus TaxID=1908235 RepID=A0A1G1TF61_9BACT|nr:hypothetical protein [Hymenobacter coccineus]OGX89503.1 hypothetical protein BEN49_08885 [Hymenobacter coccineus]
MFLGVFGIINFLGYVMTGPVVDYGDVGQAEKLLGVPVAAAIVAAVAAALAVTLAVRATAPLFLRFVPAPGPGARRGSGAKAALPAGVAAVAVVAGLGRRHGAVVALAHGAQPRVPAHEQHGAGGRFWGRHWPGRFAGGPSGARRAKGAAVALALALGALAVGYWLLRWGVQL